MARDSWAGRYTLPLKNVSLAPIRIL